MQPKMYEFLLGVPAKCNRFVWPLFATILLNHLKFLKEGILNRQGLVAAPVLLNVKVLEFYIKCSKQAIVEIDGRIGVSVIVIGFC